MFYGYLPQLRVKRITAFTIKLSSFFFRIFTSATTLEECLFVFFSFSFILFFQTLTHFRKQFNSTNRSNSTKHGRLFEFTLNSLDFQIDEFEEKKFLRVSDKVDYVKIFAVKSKNYTTGNLTKGLSIGSMDSIVEASNNWPEDIMNAESRDNIHETLTNADVIICFPIY